MTHYGPGYHFLPQGLGEKGLAWAKDVNDRRLIELMRLMKAEDIIGETGAHHNACGSGAIAATLAACKAAGARQGVLLAHATSYEAARSMQAAVGDDAVGYAAMVFG